MADVQEAPQEELALTTTSTDVSEQQPAAGKKVKKIIRRKKRPARPQIDPALIKSEPPPQTGTIFNIWYNKWSGGDREDKYLSQTAAKGRCNIAKDSGYTKADRVTGSYFCLFFARGICKCRSSITCNKTPRPATNARLALTNNNRSQRSRLRVPPPPPHNPRSLQPQRRLLRPRQAQRLPRRHGWCRLLHAPEPNHLRRTHPRLGRH